MRGLLAVALAVVLASGAAAQEPTATWTVEPAEVAVGEPSTWTLRVEHARGARLRLVTEDPAQGAGWVLIEGPTTTRARSAERASTTYSWTVLSLEGGERALPAPDVRTADGTLVPVAERTLRVQSELAPGDDAPRPLAGIPDVEGRGRGAGFGLLAAALGLAALALAAWALRRRRRRAPAAPPQPTPAERLRELRRGLEQDGAPGAPGLPGFDGRQLIFEASHVVRAGVDRSLGEHPVGLTDEEWLEHVRASGRLATGTEEDLAALLAACAEVKYGGATPTPFRVREALERAGGILGSLAEPGGRGEVAA